LLQPPALLEIDFKSDSGKKRIFFEDMGSFWPTKTNFGDPGPIFSLFAAYREYTGPMMPLEASCFYIKLTNYSNH